MCIGVPWRKTLRKLLTKEFLVMLSAPEVTGSRAFQVIWFFPIQTLKRRGTAERITRFSSNEDNSLSSEILSEAFLTRDEDLLFLKFKRRSRPWRNRIRCFLRGNLVENNLSYMYIIFNHTIRGRKCCDCCKIQPEAQEVWEPCGSCHFCIPVIGVLLK